MGRDAAFLEDIIQAAGQIIAICASRSLEEVLKDGIVQAALLHHLTVIGEAASRLSAAFLRRHAGLPWPQIVALRNRIVHAYFGLDWSVIWTSVMDDVPALRDWAVQVLARDFADEAGQEDKI